MQKTTKKTPLPDLVVLPQNNQRIPGEHLTVEEKENVLQSWRQWGTVKPDWLRGTWTVHIVHVIDQEPRLTRVREIPKI